MINRRLFVAGLVSLIGSRCLAADTVAESPTASPSCVDVKLPEGAGAGLCDFLANPAIYQQASSFDLHDLRLFDTGGREVPIAIRNRAARRDFRAFSPREFNKVTNPDRSVSLSLDLGAEVQEHNRLEIITQGSDYRRAVKIEASDDGTAWKGLANGELRYFTGSKTYDQRAIDYTPSRFRYLRITVSPERGNPSDAPADIQARVEREVRDKGIESTWPARLSERQPGRANEGYTSEWIIDLPTGERVPWEFLELEADESSFSRAYRLEQIVDKSTNPLVASGQLEKFSGKTGTLKIALSQRVVTEKLKLIVIDQRNAPLKLKLVSAKASADQILFQRTADMIGPLRLCMGNPNAGEPGYDIARTLGIAPTAQQHATLGDPYANPGYVVPADTRPLLDRKPWATNVVFGIVISALAGLLALTARKAIQAHDGEQASKAKSEASTGS